MHIAMFCISFSFSKRFAHLFQEIVCHPMSFILQSSGPVIMTHSFGLSDGIYSSCMMNKAKATIIKKKI
ncbi:hypothetical protein BDF14DRAFT_1826870 [Spinellus fusiger]|nr:hypothetical protein BDF14DRAFT_1826870 [Spinellus fusiger]